MNNHDQDDLSHGEIYDMRSLGFCAGEMVVITGAGSGIGMAIA